MGAKRKPSMLLYMESIRDARASTDGTVPVPKVRRDEDWWSLPTHNTPTPVTPTPDTPTAAGLFTPTASVRPSVLAAQEALMARIITALLED